MKSRNHWFLLMTMLCIALNGQGQLLLKEKADTANRFLKPEKSLRFIAMGDWGRNGEDHQIPVAQQMGKVAAALKTHFIVSTGDNFYPKGVVSAIDPLFRYSYEDIYTAFHLQWDWFVVLGNHDYLGNPDAQVAYSNISRRWKMPARYYHQKMKIDGDTAQVLMVFMDTNPLIPEFYRNPTYGPNVRATDSSAQKRWLSEVLSDPDPSIRWKIVVGHHPMYSGGSRTEGYDTRSIRSTLEPLLVQHQVDVYLAGHEHSLQHMVKHGVHHFISGAASEKTPARLIPESVMSASIYGFMVFSATNNELIQQTVDDSGNVVYTSTIRK